MLLTKKGEITDMKKLLLKIRPSRISFILAWFITLVVLIAPHVFAEVAGQALLVEGAKKEGKVVIYATLSVDEMRMFSDGFEKKYPFLKAESVRVSGGGVFISRVTQEASMKKYQVDVVVTPQLNSP